MEPRAATEAEMAYWYESDGAEHHAVVIGGPEEAPDVIPCPALACLNDHHHRVVHVAYQLNEIEVAALAQGGTLWLTTWGGLPIHLLEVVVDNQRAEVSPLAADDFDGSVS